VISPILFNLYMADIDRELEKRGIGKIELDKGRLCGLRIISLCG